MKIVMMKKDSFFEFRDAATIPKKTMINIEKRRPPPSIKMFPPLPPTSAA